MSEKKILIIDDEPKIVDAIKAYLEKDKYKVYVAFDGEEGLNLFEKVNPDLAIIDLMLPKISGEEICSNIRKNSRIPIIMLTAKTSEDDKINGFDIGADDYITKPFSPRELMARVNSLIRRCDRGNSPLFNTMSWNNNDLQIDFVELTIKKSGNFISLTPNEFKILSTMIKYPKKAFTREELINIAFGLEYEGFERTIDSHIKNIRSKIEDDTSHPKYILTVRGIGYKFDGQDNEI